MLVEVYGMRHSNREWEWFYTLDFDTDREFRFERKEADNGAVIRFEPFLSLGQAYPLVRKLNDTCRENVHLEQIQRVLIKVLDELGMDRSFLSRLKMVRWRKNEYGKASTSSRAPLDNRVLDRLIHILAGRFLLPEELWSLMESAGLKEWKADWKRYVQAGACMGALEVVSGMEMERQERQSGRLWCKAAGVSCRRCGSSGERLRWAECRDCGGLCPYCEACLTMGRVRRCSVLVRGKKVSDGDRGSNPDIAPVSLVDLAHWILSPAQEAASLEGLKFLERAINRYHCDAASGPPKFLIWAVTGAGKTEMIFPLVDYEIRRGRRVLITTPRRDVVLELKPRIAKAFGDYRVVALYGGSVDRWEQGDIVLATTHQLMRYHDAFDLVIIDELDAFPYHNNPLLEHAARQVCSKGGRYVLLSATPPVSMQREAAKGRLPHVKVPVRYHRHPLPIPERLPIPALEQAVKRSRLPARLIHALQASVERGAQVFVFVSKIVLVEPLVKLLSAAFPGRVVKGTSSKDEERADKVIDFRGRETNILVTTTILERGVTVPKTDVFILGAESALFDEASLVQMAGRAGRSKDDPNGKVYFASKDWTKSQVSAIRQIQSMNRIAREKGYLVNSSSDGGDGGGGSGSKLLKELRRWKQKLTFR